MMYSILKILSFCFSCTVLLVSNVQVSEGKNILFWFGVSTYSHRIAVQPLVEKLAENHNVTFVLAYEPKENHRHPNVTEFSPKSLQKIMGKFLGKDSDMLKCRLDAKHQPLWDQSRDLSAQVCTELMEDPEVVNWIKSSKFDLVIVDAFHNECGFGIAHYQKIPFMLCNTAMILMWQHDMLGFPAETSWISDLSIGYPQEMSFSQRFMNTFNHLYWYYTKVFWQYPVIETAVNKGLDLPAEDYFSIREMELKTSLVLLNTHFSIEYSRSIPPIFVPVGGMHVVKSSKGLPNDIKKFIDESGDEGFIYVSFGTTAQISKAPLELQRQFFKAFGNSSIRFVWKWEGETVPEEMPKNVITAKWMPQTDILASPKIRGFMTQGGLLSIMEATTYGVPLIVLPIFAEQDYNARIIHDLGCGIQLEFVGLKQEEIQTAIQNILENPKYKEKMEYISQIFQDRQMDPLTTAVWWTEYVLRHKSTPFLMPKGVHQYWFTRRLLDVWGSVFGSVFLIVGIILGCSLRKRRSSSSKIKTQ